MDPQLSASLDHVRRLLERGATFQAYKECRQLLAQIRAAFPPPILTGDHYANPELAVRFENTFPTWRMEVPPTDASSPPTFTPILRFANPLSVTDDQCLIFAHDMVGSLGADMSELVKHNLRDFLRSAGRSAMMNVTAITEERFFEVNGRLAYWGEGYVAARNQQAVVVAIFNEVSNFSFHVMMFCGADHWSLTRSLLETFLDRMCFEKVDMLPQ